MEPVSPLAAALILPGRGARRHRGRRRLPVGTHGAKPAAHLSRPHTSSERCSLSFTLQAHSGPAGGSPSGVLLH